MSQPRMQMSLTTMLGLVACVAVNLWLFRLGALWGILGLNVSKHVVIAALCRALGVDRPRVEPAPEAPAPRPSPPSPAS
jgi:hypothetical protein